MGTRTVDGPGRRSEFVTTKQAAAFLGLSVATFRRLVGLDPSDPDLSVPGVAHWVRPIRVGNKITWHWLAIVHLAHVLAQRAAAEEEEEG